MVVGTGMTTGILTLETFARVARPAGVTVGVVIPTRNEEKNIEDVICRLKNLGYKNVLVIDGRSGDATLKVAERNGAKVIRQNGLGKGNAVRQVLSNGYLDVDAMVMMDADGSMSPEEIPVLLQALSSGADLVKGSRFLKGGYTHDMSLLRRFGNFFFISAVNLLYSTKYTDLCYGFAVFNRRSIAMMVPLLKSENFEIEAEIFMKAKKLGLKVLEVPSVEFRRKDGKSNLKAFIDGFKILRTILQEIAEPTEIDEL